jgi:hypothetical protein
MLSEFLRLSDRIERKVKRCHVRLVGYSGSDLEGIELKEEEVELWISYFTTTSTVGALGAQPSVQDASRTCFVPDAVGGRRDQSLYRAEAAGLPGQKEVGFQEA